MTVTFTDNEFQVIFDAIRTVKRDILEDEECLERCYWPGQELNNLEQAYLVVQEKEYQKTQETRKRGLILRPLGDVIVIMPPLSINIQEIEQLLAVTMEAINKVT